MLPAVASNPLIHVHRMHDPVSRIARRAASVASSSARRPEGAVLSIRLLRILMAIPKPDAIL